MASTYGTYGGRYVPETLIPALDELTAAWEEALADESYAAELDELARNYAGPPDAADPRRPVRPGQAALPQARRPPPHRRAQAEQRTRPGSPGATARQGQDRRRDGRGPARRRDRDRLRALRARVRRLHGLRGHAPAGSERRADGSPRRGGAPVEFGTKTLKEATSEAIRDWITNVETTHYLIGSCVGPAPYPAIVRELQAVIGRETRAQVLEAEGRLPDAVIACVGGGSNAIGMFAGFLDDAEVELVGVEAAGAASLGTGRAGVLHGSRSSVLADEDGQIADAHSISAGLDYPGVGPEHAYLRDSGRARYVGTTDDEALEAFRRLTRTEGIIPALEPRARARPGRRPRRRADRRLPLGPRRQGPRRSSRHTREQDARHLSDVRAGDPGAGGGRGRGRRRSRRARLSLLRPARGRAGGPAGRREGARAGDADARRAWSASPPSASASTCRSFP